MIPFTIVGLRFDHLSPPEQAVFAFEEGRLSDACVKIKKQTQSRSVMLLGTCDRIELWCEEPRTSLVEPLLRGLSLSPLAWAKEVYTIKAQESLMHCFSLACGLLSPLFGEDQIISQIQQAFNRSVQVGCASSMLAYLVREVVTTAKQVQTTVDLQIVDQSVAEYVHTFLAPYAGQQILVLGSSALSRSVASYLAERGFVIWMTFRDTDKVDLLLPPKVHAIAYDQRFSYLPRCFVVISATKGMEYTIRKDQVQGPHLYLDLAPVRDIDPGIDGVIRIEDLAIPLVQREQQTSKALAIIEIACRKVDQYIAYRSAVPELQNLAIDAANDLVYRLQAPLKALGEEKAVLGPSIYETARKAFSHYLYAQKKAQSMYCHLDLTKSLENGQSSYAGDPPVVLSAFHTLEREGWRLTHLQFGSHAGTHMDSPAHMLEQGLSLDEFPVSRFFATAYVLDCTHLGTISIEALSAIPSGCDAVLFFTKGGSYLDEEAAAYLVERGIQIVGFDTANCDRDGDLSFPIHHIILGGGALILENLVNLERILHRSVQLTALPLFFTHADGAPARVVATYEV